MLQETDGLHHPEHLLRSCASSTYTCRSGRLIAEKRKIDSFYWRYEEKGKSCGAGHLDLCINLITLKNLRVILYTRALD